MVLGNWKNIFGPQEKFSFTAQALERHKKPNRTRGGPSRETKNVFGPMLNARAKRPRSDREATAKRQNVFQLDAGRYSEATAKQKNLKRKFIFCQTSNRLQLPGFVR